MLTTSQPPRLRNFTQKVAVHHNLFILQLSKFFCTTHIFGKLTGKLTGSRAQIAAVVASADIVPKVLLHSLQMGKGQKLSQGGCRMLIVWILRSKQFFPDSPSWMLSLSYFLNIIVRNKMKQWPSLKMENCFTKILFKIKQHLNYAVLYFDDIVCCMVSYC